MTQKLTSLLSRSLVAPLVRFWRDDSGVTAIEFGILAPPFFALIAATLETSVMFLASQVLDSAVHDASRQIRTGQAQKFTLSQFEDLVCDKLFGLFKNCHEMQVRVTPVTNFASATIQPPLATVCTTTCAWAMTETYQPGQGSSTVIVQVYYRWPMMMNLVSFAPNNQPDGTRLIGSVQVFRNEPFSS
jgi:Flp pilus assembly protein TadG